MKVVLLSGGVGGARFARGLADVLEPGELTVIGNVGDDVEVLGLHVSPDLDSLLYALAGLHDEERGWGRAGETWRALESRGGAGAARTGSGSATSTSASTSCARRRCAPASRSRRSPARLARAAGLDAAAAARDRRPAAHARRTRPRARSPFQEWFVARGHRDEVDAVDFEGAEAALPAPGVLEALAAADAICSCAEQPVRLDRADPRRRARSGRRSSAGASAASRSARSSAAAR